VSFADVEGNPKRTTRTCATKQEAKEALVTLLAQRQQGLDLTPDKLTGRTILFFLGNAVVPSSTRVRMATVCSWVMARVSPSQVVKTSSATPAWR